jgi:hypothetical protein
VHESGIAASYKLHDACCDAAMRHRMAEFKIAEQQLP